MDLGDFDFFGFLFGGGGGGVFGDLFPLFAVGVFVDGGISVEGFEGFFQFGFAVFGFSREVFFGIFFALGEGSEGIEVDGGFGDLSAQEVIGDGFGVGEFFGFFVPGAIVEGLVVDLLGIDIIDDTLNGGFAVVVVVGEFSLFDGGNDFVFGGLFVKGGEDDDVIVLAFHFDGGFVEFHCLGLRWGFGLNRP